jgi:hypothetical protein
VRTAVALATGLTAAAAAAASGHTHAAPVTPFGGSTSVRVEHVGHIEVDLGSSTARGLSRVRCSGPAAGSTNCFVAR